MEKISYKWHRLYQSYTGKFDYMYIPEYIFTTKIEPKSNYRIKVLPYENKSMLSVIYDLEDKNNFKTPTTFLMKSNGEYFDGERKLISKDKAVQLLKEVSVEYDAVIKITKDTNSEKDFRMLHLKRGVDEKTGDSINDILDSFGLDFIVQERIIPHESLLARLSPKSINTLRAITYIANNQINVAPIVLRIGQGGGEVDNAHAGGMFIGVNFDGELCEEAFTENENRFTFHPDTGVSFKNYTILFIDDICEISKELHIKTPMFEHISWDFTIDSDDNVVLIEANLHSQSVWISQMAHGKSFYGNQTKFILNSLRDKKSD